VFLECDGPTDLIFEKSSIMFSSHLHGSTLERLEKVIPVGFDCIQDFNGFAQHCHFVPSFFIQLELSFPRHNQVEKRLVVKMYFYFIFRFCVFEIFS
jgi:hypothetical protein